MSKMGLGLYERKPELFADANTVNANVALIFHYALDIADQLAPSIERMGREYWSTADQDAMLLSTDLAGLRTMGQMQAESLCDMWPAITCWQGLNEVMRVGVEDWLRRQVAFELGFADGCSGRGKTMCCLNAPPGVEPVPAEMFFASYAEIIRPLMAHPAVRYWGRHVYSAHRTAHLWDDPEWFALRHRKIAAGLRAAGVRVPPIAVTELGWADGWRAAGLQDYQAADDLEWFADQIADDPDIAVTMVFCDGDSGGWQDHDVHATGIIGRLAAWNAAHPSAPIGVYVPPEGGTVYEWKYAFVQAAVQYGAGNPTTDIMYDHLGNAWQYGEEGLLFSHKADNWKVYWFSKNA